MIDSHSSVPMFVRDEGHAGRIITLKYICDRAARVGEVANDNQRKTKCVQNKQEFNGQLVEKKYNNKDKENE